MIWDKKKKINRRTKRKTMTEHKKSTDTHTHTHTAVRDREGQGPRLHALTVLGAVAALHREEGTTKPV
jgi:hypothetical protein